MTLLAVAMGVMLSGVNLSSADQSGSAQSSDAPATAQLPVSAERIHDRLQRPAALQMPREPDFRAKVSEEFERPETVLDALRRELSGDRTAKRVPPGTISPALFTVDLLQMAMQIKRQLSATFRARAERSARAEVAAVLAEFCAQHDCSVLEPSQPHRSDGEGGNSAGSEGVLTH